MNNKGVSIIELIVSVALISVVMVFMYRLLADISYEKDSDYFAVNNQIQRVEIIDSIEKTIYASLGVKKYQINSPQKLTLTLYESGSSKDYILNYYEKDNQYIVEFNNNKWTLKKGYTLDDQIICKENNANDKKTAVVECTIKVYSANENNIKDNNNTIDDITFSFTKLV